MTALTIGMATYNDFDGVYFSVQSLRLYQDLADTELLVIDNFGCEHTERFCKQAGVRYLLAKDVTGTAAPRDLIFKEARGDAVLCIDSHVLLDDGVVARLRHYYQDHPDTPDLLQGPLRYDGMKSIATHFEPVWQAQMWGRWDTDKRALDPEAEPFDIPMQGLGIFSCRKAAWPGFNPAFRGFGGEEGYIHEKFRQAGGRTLCLPWLRWLHRFGRPNGVPYPLAIEHKLRNYLIGHLELGLDPLLPITHFSAFLPDAKLLAQTNRTLSEFSNLRARRDGDHFVLEPQESIPTPPPALPVTPQRESPSQPQSQQPLQPLDYTPAIWLRADLPLISCICPTYNRPPRYQHLVEEAIESFLRQDYPNKELLILNDCAGQVLLCDAPGVRVVNVPNRYSSLGVKREAGTRLTTGALIAPWDDDDISLPWRLSASMERLGKAGYYNPMQNWFMQNNEIKTDAGMANGYFQSIYPREAFEAVGGNPDVSLGEDQEMHGRMMRWQKGRPDQPNQTPLERDEFSYIYRWGVSNVHLSGIADESFYQDIGEKKIARGRFQLNPHWRRDYVADVVLATASMLASNRAER